MVMGLPELEVKEKVIQKKVTYLVNMKVDNQVKYMWDQLKDKTINSMSRNDYFKHIIKELYESIENEMSHLMVDNEICDMWDELTESGKTKILRSIKVLHENQKE